ncbi:hypothetical protein ACFE04_020161 [Oxalis oulophora]
MSTSDTTTTMDPTTAPLLRPRSPNRTTTLAVLLGRATGRRAPSMLVRETAARELDERRADWGYSKPVVALDIMWNIAFVVLAVTMLVLTLNEKPNTPLRVWICGYAVQCLVHVVLVWLEYRRRNNSSISFSFRASRRRLIDEEQPIQQQQQQEEEEEVIVIETSGDGNNVEQEVEVVEQEQQQQQQEVEVEDEDVNEGRVSRNWRRSSVTRRIESVNTMASFLWWIIGFYWVVSGGNELLQHAPRLYWLAVVFLAFDVFFAVFCVVLACLIGIALCCCLPCIIAILYAVAGQEGASEADLSSLPKYRFQIVDSDGKSSNVGAGKMVPVETSSEYLANERILLPEDAECCICLMSYEDGTELHTLPCNHHFHTTCIIRWLKMNATCPLCKFNILKGTEQASKYGATKS